MCRDHWYRVPAHLRRQVTRTWREFLNASAGTPERRFALVAYRQAAEAATQAAAGAMP